MPAILVRDLDDATIALLKERARRSHRSLQGEVRTILEEVVRPRRPTRGRARRRPLPIHVVDVPSHSSYSRDEIYGNDGR